MELCFTGNDLVPGDALLQRSSSRRQSQHVATLSRSFSLSWYLLVLRDTASWSCILAELVTLPSNLSCQVLQLLPPLLLQSTPQNQQFQHCSTIVQYTSIPNNPKPSETIGSACQEYCLFRSTCIRDLGKHRFLTIINHTPTKHATLILLVKAKHCLRCPEEITSGFFIGDMVTSVNLFTPE